MDAVEYLSTPVGTLCLRADGEALYAVTLTAQKGAEAPNLHTREAALQLQEYFQRKRKEFTVKLRPRGTPFQISVWRELARIPYGTSITYGQLAAAVGRPNACRATGNAVGKNPLLILIPCHRVVAANGIGGFSSGLEVKRALLHLEGVQISPFDK